jgi:hypothetical protein
MTQLVTCIYGAIFIGLLYFFIKMLYSVQYTPGSTTIYNSPVAQALFPGEPNKLSPTWGYNELGMIKQDPTKYGQNGFWPKSGPGFEPTALGSGGPSPSGGMRSGGTGPTESEVGWWKGDITYPSNTITSIYDNDAEIPEKKVTVVGWWGNE